MACCVSVTAPAYAEKWAVERATQRVPSQVGVRKQRNQKTKTFTRCIMTTNWSAERHDCLTQVESEAERRPSLCPFAARTLPVEAIPCKAEEFILGSPPMNTEVFSFVHLILETGKKITNWLCENCRLVQFGLGGRMLRPPQGSFHIPNRGDGYDGNLREDQRARRTMAKWSAWSATSSRRRAAKANSTVTRVAKDAKVTCDGKASKAADLKAGTHVRVTAHKDDKTVATAVESGKQSPATGRQSVVVPSDTPWAGVRPTDSVVGVVLIGASILIWISMR